jgi:hypothetical protein
LAFGVDFGLNINTPTTTIRMAKSSKSAVRQIAFLASSPLSPQLLQPRRKSKRFSISHCRNVRAGEIEQCVDRARAGADRDVKRQADDTEQQQRCENGAAASDEAGRRARRRS